jgi:protein-S-isoprenylcysteine O-methyltransferase Ste14
VIFTKESVLPDYAVFILRFIIFAAVHSLFAATRVKKMIGWMNEKEPRFYRLIYNLGSLVVFGWVMAAYRNSPVLYYAPGVWSLMIYLIQLVVAAILFNCLRQTGTADFLGFKEFRTATSSERHLVTSGCYAIVRHPLYLLSSIFMIINPVMSAQWLLLTTLSAIYFISGALIEERRLVATFGDEYRRYQQCVPFMIPSRRGLRDLYSKSPRQSPEA